MVHRPQLGSEASRPDPRRYLSRRGFRQYRGQAVQHARDILRRGAPGEFDEQALPAYTHPNLLMRWLFWQRLRCVVNFFDKSVQAGARVLDFGCGVGVLLPLLAARGHSLAGVDIDLRFAPRYLEAFGVEGVTLCDAAHLDDLAPGSFDVITALDVLEHVDNLEQTIERLGRLLKPGGAMLVCGPTENILYKAGRWLAGFSGDYHVRDIASIHQSFQRRFTTTTIATLYPGMPLFRLFVAANPTCGLAA